MIGYPRADSRSENQSFERRSSSPTLKLRFRRGIKIAPQLHVMHEKMNKQIKTVLALLALNLFCAWCSIIYTLFSGAVALWIASEIDDISFSTVIWGVTLSVTTSAAGIYLISRIKEKISQREDHKYCAGMIILSSALIYDISVLFGLIAVIVFSSKSVRSEFDNRSIKPLYPTEEATEYMD